MIEKEERVYEKSILIGIITKNQDADKLTEFLDELEFLTYTAGGEVVKRFTQKMDVPNSKTFIGSGKMEEVLAYVEQHDIGTVVFDDELTPAQTWSGSEEELVCVVLVKRRLKQIDV